MGALRHGAQERTRTSTPVKALVPETSASTNSATWAGSRDQLGAHHLEAGAKLVNCDADCSGGSEPGGAPTPARILLVTHEECDPLQLASCVHGSGPPTALGPNARP